MKKFIKRVLTIIFLLILYIYIMAIQSIPDKIVIFEGESFKFHTIYGMKTNIITPKETIETVSTDTNRINEVGKKVIKLSLFDNIFIKDINVDVISKTKVIPVGSIAGLKLYTSGVLVVGMSEIQGADNKKYKPYENCGINEGDTIISINNNKIDNTDELIKTVNSSNGQELKVEFIHDSKAKECSITPIKTSLNEYKLGLWVRDSAAGIGTVTFYEPSTKSFGALGHGITDIDTNKLIDISSGQFVNTRIINIVKGEKGNPGKIQGTLENQLSIGTISKNTNYGIYGRVDNLSSLNIDPSKEIEVALREEIKTGKAKILCSLENNKIEEFEIEIKEIYKENNYNNKSMLIKITDKNLINKTGGIIQGMSGAPIIQNEKFIGAITHVLVNSLDEGYAVFGDLMIKQMKTIE